MNIAKEYNVEIGLTPSDIEAIVNGEMSTLHFYQLMILIIKIRLAFISSQLMKMQLYQNK